MHIVCFTYPNGMIPYLLRSNHHADDVLGQEPSPEIEAAVESKVSQDLLQQAYAAAFYVHCSLYSKP